MFADPNEVWVVVVMCLVAYIWGVVAGAADMKRRKP